MSNNDAVDDRLSYLPEQELHRILSFLDMKEVVHTSLLSKRWRYTWQSVPHLNFDHSLWQNLYTDILLFPVLYKVEFLQFVEQVLFLHSGSTIRKFSLSGAYHCADYHIEKWLSKVLRCRAEEIHLELDGYTMLPQFLFTSSSQLKTLHLISAQLPTAYSNGEIVLKCPVLETLVFRHCHHHSVGVLFIDATQLRYLAIENCCRGCASTCLFKISAPSLQSLELKGYMYREYVMDNISALVQVRFGYVVHERVNLKNLLKLLKCVQHATTLDISDCWLQENIDRSNLIENSQQLCAEYMFKVVNIQNLEGSKTDLFFLEILLKNGKALESVALTTTRARSRTSRKNLAKFGKKVQALPRASATTTIHFVVRTWI